MEKCKNCGEECIDVLTHERYCDKVYHLKDDVLKMYENGISIKKISDALKISRMRVMKFLKGKTRNISDSTKLAHKLYPEKFKHTEETKKLLSKKRLEWMKNNPEKTAWRLSNMSYPEKLMFNKFLELEYDKKYLIVREKSVFPYFIDFAFENEKIALEIDGSQHLLPERLKNDILKDELLIKNNWTVIRVSDYEVKNNIDNIIKILEDKLFDNDKIEKIQVGIVTEISEKKYIKKERKENGFTNEEILSHIKQRIVERPPFEELKKEVKMLGLEGTGRKYNVTGNSIKKWIKTYKKMGL